MADTIQEIRWESCCGKGAREVSGARAISYWAKHGLWALGILATSATHHHPDKLVMVGASTEEVLILLTPTSPFTPLPTKGNKDRTDFRAHDSTIPFLVRHLKAYNITLIVPSPDSLL